MMMRYSILTVSCMAALLASACTPVGIAAGAGATVGIAATKEGGLSQSASDFRIRTSISDLWFKSNIDIFRKLNLSVEQGRVLITGVVQDPNHRVEAVRLAWQPKGVKQVINEIQVADSDGFPGYVRDTWITTSLRAKMTVDAEIQSINYSIETVQGIVYLMGIARSQDELDHVIDVARRLRYVKQVISYVKLPGDEVLTNSGNATGVGRGASQPAVQSQPLPVTTDTTSSGSGAVHSGGAQPIMDSPMTNPSVERTTLPP